MALLLVFQCVSIVFLEIIGVSDGLVGRHNLDMIVTIYLDISA